jgi:uncharacterized membrane protein YeaQ/YmgE (transglycosylase-associated protein family)
MILAWILLGLVSGSIASRIVSAAGHGLLRDMLLGAAGALVGGAAFHLVGQRALSGLDVWSALVAVAGSLAVLLPFYVVSGRRASA